MKKVKIGTRRSELALWQSHWVESELKKAYPDLTVELKKIQTLGDKVLDTPLAKIGSKGLFTKELDRALLNRDVDLAVHSMKDVPTELPDGLVITAVTERWDTHDVLLPRNGGGEELFSGKRTIATGSLRRRAQLLHHNPDYNIIDIRGNLNTRLKKLQESDWDGMILAKAGVERLGWDDVPKIEIPFDIMLPAVGQGSFAIVCREDNTEVRELLARLDDEASRIGIEAERALLRAFGGGCQMPLGARGTVDGDVLKLEGCIAHPDGSTLLRDTVTVQKSEAAQAGQKLADMLMGRGGDAIMRYVDSLAD